MSSLPYFAVAGLQQRIQSDKEDDLQKKSGLVTTEEDITVEGKHLALRENDGSETETLNDHENKPGQQDEMLMSNKWTRDHLDCVCDNYGSKSIKVKKICADVIVNTKKKIEDLTSSMDIVADIYPSYTIKTPNRIVFVITLKREVDESLIKDNIPFATELRVLGCYSVEAKSVYKSEIVEPMSVKDQLKVKQCINMNCDKLFERHRYLSIITASNKRSRGFKTDNHNIEKQLCLVLFVHAKGFIPIDEDSFSDMYGEFAIDVLEGVFTPYVKTCKDYHDDVKIGCKISRGTTGGGTLGGFIDHHKHGLVGLTCAHALLNGTEFSCFANNVSNLVLGNWPEQYRDEEKRHVFQPDEIHSQAPLGQIVEAAYCPGGDYRSGVDAVLFRVEKRFPLSGGCPSVLRDGENIDPAFSFETGKICGPLPFPDNIVTKFGAATELTNGLLEFEVPFVCARTIDLLDMETDSFKIQLLHQYQVALVQEAICLQTKAIPVHLSLPRI